MVPESITAVANPSKSRTSKLDIDIIRAKKSRISEVDFHNIPFGRIFSDHIFVVDYKDGQWQKPQIRPFDNMSISPACSALHYGQSIFEGMKANLDESTGEVLLFRPEKNAERLNNSAIRMGMPTLPVETYVEGLKALIDIDRQWVPDVEDTALYIRPFMFANDHFIGVKKAANYRFIIFTCPVGAYYDKPVSVWIEKDFKRAFPGGTGAAKAAGNYAATLYPASLVNEKGYDQILWTDGLESKYVEEIGTMNVFFVIDGKAITPELDGTILEGITRESIVQLMKDRGIEVEERKLSVEEILAAHKNHTLQEVSGVGTAATITHISGLGYEDVHYELPPVADRKISNSIREELVNIKLGIAEDKHNWIVRV
ncbi:MAG: branched-chain amino acid aminotransferase [Chitinophagales bacterium]